MEGSEAPDARFELILYSVTNGVATIRLNRPDKLNALNGQIKQEIETALDLAEADPNVRAVVLTGVGKAFSVGADIQGGAAGTNRPDDEVTPLEWDEYLTHHVERQFRTWDFPKPTIAAVDGYCLARGCELALWCDIVLAADTARIGQPETRMGAIVESITPWRTTPGRAKLFLLSGDVFDAAEAERLGIVDRVVPADRLMVEAQKLGEKIASSPEIAIRQMKDLVNHAYETMGIRAAQQYSLRLSVFNHLLSSKERGTEHLQRIREEQGFKAFLDARDAPFKEIEERYP